MDATSVKIKCLSCNECTRLSNCLVIKIRGTIQGVCEKFKENKKLRPKEKKEKKEYEIRNIQPFMET